MDRTGFSDCLTVIAIASLAYAAANISHEIIGHCGTAALLGSKCKLISTTYIPLATEIPNWKFRILALAGSAANWLVALVCLAILRGWRNASPSWRFFLWLSVCVNLFVPSTYLLVSPAILFGDWYNMIADLRQEIAWRIVLTVAGTGACWFSFRLCRAELIRLTGLGGKSARSNMWELIAPAYVAGGIVTIAAALLSPLPAKWAQLQAVGGTFGLTFWLLLLPLGTRERLAPAQPPFFVPRSIGWIIAGALGAMIFIGMLGPGIQL